MTKRLGLSAMHRSTHYAPLAALGAFLQQRDFFAPLWEHVQLGGKTIDHEPHQRLLDVVVSMLADCSSLKQIHTRLRPDTALAAAWGRDVFADQSTLSRTLGAFPPVTGAQLRTAVEPCSGWTAALAQTGTSTGLCGMGIPSWAKDTVANGPTRWPGVCRSGKSCERASVGWLQRPYRSTSIGAPRPQ